MLLASDSCACDYDSLQFRHFWPDSVNVVALVCHIGLKSEIHHATLHYENATNPRVGCPAQLCEKVRKNWDFKYENNSDEMGKKEKVGKKRQKNEIKINGV